MWRDAALVAGKDLRIEWHSRVAVSQIVPFALAVLLLFAFALDPDRGVLERVTPGLFWLAVLFSALLAVQRSAAVEAADQTRDALVLAGLEPGGVFLGKAAAVAVQLVVLQVALAVGVALLYTAQFGAPLVLVATCVVATAGLAAAGTLYAALAAGVKGRETILPLLLLPLVVPVLIGATRAWEAGMTGVPAEGWPWVALLTVFAVLAVALGLVAFGPLLEET